MSSSSKKDENQCYTYFRIVGDFNPDEISLKLGLHPYDSWKAEDKKNLEGHMGFLLGILVSARSIILL